MALRHFFGDENTLRGICGTCGTGHVTKSTGKCGTLTSVTCKCGCVTTVDSDHSGDTCGDCGSTEVTMNLCEGEIKLVQHEAAV